MIWLTKLALKKKWLTYILAAIIAGVSIWATLTLKMELIPEIELPMTTVVTVYPQAQPEEVMNEVTIPVESAISGIEGLKHIVSTSSTSSSFVFAQFEYGTHMADVNAIIAGNLETINLPAEVRSLPQMMPEMGNNPRLYPIDINMMPIVTLSLNGNISVQELRQVAVSQIVPVLEEVEGVLEVSIEGGDANKVIVSPSMDKMNDNAISTAQIAGALTMQEYSSLNAIENTIISADGLLLKDIADINLTLPQGSTISRTNGNPSINISITKSADANTVTTANEVISTAENLQKSLPPGLELVTIMDQSDYIEDSVSDLTNSALLGVGLAVIIVFLFLMAVRPSLVTAIPERNGNCGWSCYR